MVIRPIKEAERDQYNSVVDHPLQSWQWGEFKRKTGVKVIRLGIYDGRELVFGLQLTIHSLPYLPYTVGYLPKGPLPDEEMLRMLVKVGKENRCIFIKLEPNVKIANQESGIRNQGINHLPGGRMAPWEAKLYKHSDHRRIGKFILHRSPHPLFPKYTFQIDLTKPAGELLRQMHQKTRYNVRLAQRKGVVIEEDNSDKAFEEYLRLTYETTKRQGFYAHDKSYHRLMWQGFHPSGIAHLLTAKYKGEILVTWIIFLFNNVLYYPYGASSSKYRNLMASNLMMWEAIRWGKAHGAKIFDLWGCLGPNPNSKDPWYGFHRFKEGYGPRLVEFIGSYDLILNHFIYKVYNVANALRWIVLKLKSLERDILLRFKNAIKLRRYIPI